MGWAKKKVDTRLREFYRQVKVEKVNNDRSKNSPNLGPTFSVDYYNINLSLLSQFDHKGLGGSD